MGTRRLEVEVLRLVTILHPKVTLLRPLVWSPYTGHGHAVSPPDMESNLCEDWRLKEIVGTFNPEKALVGAFFVIVSIFPKVRCQLYSCHDVVTQSRVSQSPECPPLPPAASWLLPWLLTPGCSSWSFLIINCEDDNDVATSSRGHCPLGNTIAPPGHGHPCLHLLCLHLVFTF